MRDRCAPRSHRIMKVAQRSGPHLASITSTEISRYVDRNLSARRKCSVSSIDLVQHSLVAGGTVLMPPS
jgi:hypothetical protein